MYHCGLLLVLLDLSFDVVAGTVSQLEIDRHLELGKDFLAKGQLQDALSHYHAAVEGDPSNYLTYYKRGTVYLALSKAKLALRDLEKVLELKPSFTAARLQRGKILLKQAEFDLAEHEFLSVLSLENDNEDTQVALERLLSLREDVDTVREFIKHGDHDSAVDLISKVINECPWSPELRDLRADSYIAMENYFSAMSDINSTIKLVPDNTRAIFTLASLHYRLGQVDDSLMQIRNCLKFDPDHKECFDFYKKTKEIAKRLKKVEIAEESKEFDTCINIANWILNNEKSVLQVQFLAYEHLCRCYTGNLDATRAINSCNEALKIKEDAGVYCDSAEAYLATEMYDDAIIQYKKALEQNPNLQRAKQGLQKAQQRQKLSETRDYYSILGVPRTASKQDIVKAYRNMARKWHPDNFQEGDEKKRAQKKFIDIAAAKEVLTDDEKRNKFDQGEDPLDPESGKYSTRFSPFQEFHEHHFHGSPFQFKFHFN